MPWKPMATYYNRAFNVCPYPEPSAEESLSILALARDTASEEGFLIHGQKFANLKLPLIDALQHAPPRPAGYELEANTSGNPSVEQIVRVPLIEGEDLEDVDVRTPRWDAFEKELRRNGKSLCVGLLEGINGSDTVTIKQVKERMVKVTRRMPPADCECGVPCFHVEIEPDPR